MKPSPEASIRQAARAAGFDEVGIARLDAMGDEAGRHLAEFIAAGRHGDMHWLAAHAERRRHPRAMWPDARSAVVLGLSYGPSSDPLAILGRPDRGAISVYAQGRDYHDVVKGKLKQVAAVLSRAAGGADVKVFVDTAPLMEKPLAALAGLGWQGRHTNLVSRRLGSWLFLGVILTDAELVPDPPATDRCGSCRRCIDVCPTDAFPAPYQLDARRCISYLTIEHKGPIDRELRPRMGNRIYGCDDCLAVCPWNKFATAGREARLEATAAAREPSLAELLDLDDAAFRQRFAGSPVKRTGRDRFLRNVLIAAGNSRSTELVRPVRRLLGDASALVRGAAVWAFARLVGRDALAAEAKPRMSLETDAGVIAEWQVELET
ncbi:MAG: tRNA epoxyqueuosine(34) reductase QueG [Hyphomicrobiaceae bacterium]